MTGKIADVIITGLLVVLLLNCSSTDDAIAEFLIETSVNQNNLNGNVKNDEDIIIEFKLSNVVDSFSHLEFHWEYQDTLHRIKSLPIKFTEDDFMIDNQTFTRKYFISEERLYGSIFTNLDSIARDAQLKLSWAVYDLENIEINTNQGKEIIIDIKCIVDESFMIGEYYIESIATSIFWGQGTYIKSDTISISKGDNDFERIVPITFANNSTSFKTIFNCGTIGMSSEPLEVFCNEGIIFYSESPNDIDFQNDDTIIIDFILDYTNDCDFIPTSPKDRITLTRIK